MLNTQDSKYLWINCNSDQFLRWDARAGGWKIVVVNLWKTGHHCLWCYICYREISILNKTRLPFSVVSVMWLCWKEKFLVNWVWIISFLNKKTRKYLIVDAYPKNFPPKITTCDCLNFLEITITFLLTIWPTQTWLYFIVCFRLWNYYRSGAQRYVINFLSTESFMHD